MAKQVANRPRAKKSVQAGPLLPPAGGVAIRMYRLGLGDCFLLAMAGNKGAPVYMLIDCGVHPAQQGGRQNMALVFEDLVRATGGHLHLVVVTHEHADHVSGFMQQAKRFSNGDLTIDRLWLAWTESDQDADAVRMRRAKVAAHQAIEAALQKLEPRAGAVPAMTSLRQRLAAATALFDVEPYEGDKEPSRCETVALLAGARGSRERNASNSVLALLKRQAAQVEFLDADDRPIPVPGTAAVRAYVLGPPREDVLLNGSDLAVGDRHETYLNSAIGLHSFSAAILQGLGETPDSDGYGEIAYPFDRRYRRSYEWASQQPFFQTNYAFNGSTHQPWRQIECDWLRAAEEIAVHLDRHINNSSLVLALELGEPGHGPVLLFVGDAQVGNWLSWRNLRWRINGLSLGVPDLLRRTLVYKTGHHASHHATLRRDDQGQEYGLELMPDGLIALMPVDQEAATQLPGWNMPCSKLYQVLKRKTRGNILRSDDGHDNSLCLPRSRKAQVPGVEGASWRCSNSNKADGKPLYYDLYIQQCQT